jgi:hypothetical protein
VSTSNPAQATHPKRNPRTSFRDFGDEGGLVVLPGRAEVKVLNAVGMSIYPLLDGNHSRDQIVEAIVAGFEISPEQAREDLDAFLAELGDNGMLADPETV